MAKFEYPDWTNKANCLDRWQHFYPPEGKSKLPVEDGLVAEALCATCPVKIECRGYVFELERATGFVYGYWAGMTQQQREELYRERAINKLKIRRKVEGTHDNRDAVVEAHTTGRRKTDRGGNASYTGRTSASRVR